MFLPKNTIWKQTLPTSFLAAATADGTAPIGRHSARSSARRSFIRSAAQRSPLAVASFAAAAAHSRRSSLPLRNLLARNFMAGALGRSLMNLSFNRNNGTVDGLMSSATRMPYIYDRNMLRNNPGLFRNQWIRNDSGLSEAAMEEREEQNFENFVESFVPKAVFSAAPALTFFQEIKQDAISIKNSFAASLCRAQEVCRKMWAHGGPAPEKINLPVLANNQ
jgi:hypothetical protein